ncbi:MAG: AAA family ATPase, partial [Saprospiraceae bacterium]|nr:AAA family ATPase [Saprospiraceae bacterium]
MVCLKIPQSKGRNFLLPLLTKDAKSWVTAHSGLNEYFCGVMLDRPPLQLNEDFKHALDVLEKTQRSIFITGRAGTGKSTLLQLFRSTTRKKIAVLAPTGVAALNVQGQTIHSFFG